MSSHRDSGAGSPLGAIAVILGLMGACVLVSALPKRSGPYGHSGLVHDSILSDTGIPSDTSVPPDSIPPDTGFYQPEVAEAPGIAVAVLVDASYSMRAPPPGSETPKYVLARDAVARVLEATAGHLREHPETPVKVGVYYFSTEVHAALPMAPYDAAAVRAALERPAYPHGFTAIGDAMEAARLELYHSGATRKYILVVTDGVNTVGASPAEVAREIRDRSEGGVGMFFVAFDVDPAKFAFVEEAGGEVLPATGGDQLREALSKVYRMKILAEAEDYGDGFAVPRDTARGAP